MLVVSININMFILEEFTTVPNDNVSSTELDNVLSQFDMKIIGCSESSTVGFCQLKTFAENIVLEESGGKRVETAYRKDRNDHVDFNEGVFLVIDNEQIYVYKKERIVNNGYISSSIEDTITLWKVLKMIQCQLTCREMTESESVHFVRSNVPSEIDPTFNNVIAEMKSHPIFNKKNTTIDEPIKLVNYDIDSEDDTDDVDLVADAIVDVENIIKTDNDTIEKLLNNCKI